MMLENLAMGAFAIALAILWAGYMISSAVTAASNERRRETDRLAKILVEMGDQLKWTNDSVKRVEQRLPPPPERFG